MPSNLSTEGALVTGSLKGDLALTAGIITAFTPGPEDLVIAGALAAKAGQGIKLSLKAKDGWNDAQKAEAAAKVQKLDGLAKQGDLAKTSPQRSSTSAGSRYRQAGNDVPSGSDVDHVQDLQLGGADNLDNMAPLDSSVNPVSYTHLTLPTKA